MEIPTNNGADTNAEDQASGTLPSYHGGQASVSSYEQISMGGAGMSEGFNVASIQVPVASLFGPAFALDIGGSLAKLAYTKGCNKCNKSNDRSATVHMVTFQANDLDTCLKFIKQNVLHKGQPEVRGHATGVGCVKYRDKIMETLGLSLTPDSMEMLHATRGLQYLWRHLQADTLLMEGTDKRGLTFNTDIRDGGLLPCLLVNIGSAMTIVKVDNDGNMRNIVGGSTLAGLSLLGLGALLTKAKTFSELVELAEQGDNTKVDLFVQDTAGEEYNQCPQEGMVSSFGRAATATANGQKLEFSEEDLANSLLKAITDNLAATTFYVARSENMHRVCFCGSFISKTSIVHKTIIQKLKDASMFLQYEVQPVFLQHESYLGALGVLASVGEPSPPEGRLD